MENYIPPFKVTNKMINLVSEISENIGSLSVRAGMNSNPKLRRENRIRTIHASLAIENNTLTLEQMTAIIDGKRVLGKPKEILEVKNAFDAYEIFLTMNPFSVNDLLRAHKLMMNELVKEAGVFRSGGVGIFAGEKLVHMAPPANLIPQLINQLIKWYEESMVHPLIKSCVFHYEFEFIHPFADGNGRIGRMWHTLILSKWKELFAWLPIETLVKQQQQEYYDMLGKADKEADSTCFVEFMLETILEVLKETI